MTVCFWQNCELCNTTVLITSNERQFQQMCSPCYNSTNQERLNFTGGLTKIHGQVAVYQFISELATCLYHT